jgi:altronate dehydratase large subunit
VDQAVAAGATVIVSETAEFIGGEEVVRAQSLSSAIADSIIGRIAMTEARMAGDGDHYRGVNPTAENIEAGLTTLVEKTMGALCKIGQARFAGCLDFGEPPPVAGLHFMDTPFFSPCSITGMLAAGAQLTLFSMGVFNPSGNPLAPTLKVCGNPDTLAHWADGIDVGLAELIDGRIGLDEAGRRVHQAVMRVAEGEVTHTERWGEGQFIIPRMLPTF